MNKKFHLRASFIYSLLMFVVTYYLLQLNSQLLTIFISNEFYLDITWFPTYLTFEPSLTAPYVPSDTKMTVAMAGPILSLVIGMVLLFLYLFEDAKLPWLSFLFFWGFIHGFNNFFGVISMNAFAEANMLNVSNILNIGVFPELIFAASALYVLVLIGQNSGEVILIKNGNSIETSRRGRFWFMSAGVFLPMVLGSGLILLLNLMNKSLFFLPFISIIALGVPAFLKFLEKVPEFPQKNRYRHKIHWGIVLLSIIFVTLYLLLTKNGIKI